MIYFLLLLLAQNSSTYLKKTDQLITLPEIIQKIKTDSFAHKAIDEQVSLTQATLDLNKSNILYPDINMQVSVGNHSLLERDVPTQEFRLAVEKYTIFNWGRDKKSILSSVKAYERDSLLLDKESNALRYLGISLYFKLVTSHKDLETYNQKLAHASYLYRLNRERNKTGAVTNVDYYRTRDKYLEAQNDQRKALVALYNVSEEISRMINQEDLNINYTVDTDIGATPLTLDLASYYDIAAINNQEIKALGAEFEKLTIDHELLLMDNLFLPKIDLNLAIYNWNSENGVNRETVYKPNLEASVNATWQLFGGNGFLNGRLNRITALSRNIVKNQQEELKVALKREIQRLMTSITSHQDTIDIQDAKSLNSKTYFDTALSEYTKNQLDLNTLMNALDNMIKDRLDVSFSYLEQILLKVRLAELLGVAHLPGDPFENLAVKK